MKNQTKYLTELVVTNGIVKVKLAKKLRGVNQHVRHWDRVNARNVARLVNRSSLVIK